MVANNSLPQRAAHAALGLAAPGQTCISQDSLNYSGTQPGVHETATPTQHTALYTPCAYSPGHGEWGLDKYSQPTCFDIDSKNLTASCREKIHSSEQLCVCKTRLNANCTHAPLQCIHQPHDVQSSHCSQWAGHDMSKRSRRLVLPSLQCTAGFA